MDAWRRPLLDDPDMAEHLGDPADLIDAQAFLEDLLRRPAWHGDAACREHPAAMWFPSQGEDVSPAREICAGCLVRHECRTFALEQPSWLAGVWAGTTGRDRRLRRTASRRDAA